MFGWHHWWTGHEFQKTLGDGRQGSLACCSPWGHKESDTTEQLQQQLKYYQQKRIPESLLWKLLVFLFHFQIVYLISWSTVISSEIMCVLSQIPWNRKWQPILLFLPGKSHRQRSLVGYNPCVTELDMTEHVLSRKHESYCYGSEQPSVKQGYRKQRRRTNRNWVLWHWIFDHVIHLGKCCQRILLYLINVLQNLPPEYIKVSSYTLLEHPVFSLGFLWQLVIIYLCNY